MVEKRERLRSINGHRIDANTKPRAARTIWLTGLPCAGKSSLAAGVKQRFANLGHPLRVLDGDVLRAGLCSDLGFSATDRSENIRRVAEVARLFNETGISVVAALISPMAADRELARSIIGPDCFLEVYLSAGVEICAARDVKGMYARAKRGEIPCFTGVSAPYEIPADPDYVIDTGQQSLEDSVTELCALVAGESARNPESRERLTAAL